jgi:hypothetical protein
MENFVTLSSTMIHASPMPLRGAKESRFVASDEPSLNFHRSSTIGTIDRLCAFDVDAIDAQFATMIATINISLLSGSERAQAAAAGRRDAARLGVSSY